MAYSRGESKRSTLGFGVLLGAVLLTLAGCGGGDDHTSASDKYEQTWATSYDETTCAAFKGEMTEQQRWAMAADMLVGARSADGVSEMPDDDMVTTFEQGLDNACVIEDATMSDMGAALYLTEQDRFGEG